MLTASVVIDLTAATKPENMRHKVAYLPDCPPGARVVVHVGALAPEPSVVRVLALHGRRLCIDLQGTPAAVRRWLEAVRTNIGAVLV